MGSEAQGTPARRYEGVPGLSSGEAGQILPPGAVRTGDMNQYPAANPYAPPQQFPVGAPAYAQAPYAAAPSAHVEGKLLVAANGSALPAMCLKCGGPAQHWRAQRYQYTPPWAFFFFGWLGVLIFSKRSSFQVPVCQEHQAAWKKWNLIAGLSWIPGVLFWAIGAAVGDDVGAVLLLVGTVVFFAGLFAALIVRSRKIVMPRKIDKTHTWLRGVHPTVLDAVAMPQPDPRAYAMAQPPQAPYGAYPS